ncbi:MAG: ketoacyl-ACP synthase III [Chitinophagia bacterium]|jgi:3-oxoacyl-[acyl-carrier-protein] synthase-3|nr:ketoacyl-ACP synthase III [Chitinophagia bacterium]
MATIISGTGSYIPSIIKTNLAFAENTFYGEDGVLIKTPNAEIVEKFKDITGIYERRYAEENMNTSEMASKAAELAIQDAGIDPETIDQIIVAHNFGDVLPGTIQTDTIPALASRVKHHLGIKNPNCVAYDILFGCPGWIQGVIQADSFIKSGMAKRCLVIGAETLSRVVDSHDRDSMIFSDGAGACIVEEDTNTNSGILASSVQSHCVDETYFLYLGKSYHPEGDEATRYIKMKGRKVYEYAIKNVPLAMKECIEKAGVDIHDIKKFFLHQANEKMDEGFIKALYKLYDIRIVPENVMPMSIHDLGNSSVATIPTLYDLVKRGKYKEHQLHKGDIVIFASVGAGMNINAICYRV